VVTLQKRPIFPVHVNLVGIIGGRKISETFIIGLYVPFHIFRLVIGIPTEMVDESVTANRVIAFISSASITANDISLIDPTFMRL